MTKTNSWMEFFFLSCESHNLALEKVTFEKVNRSARHTQLSCFHYSIQRWRIGECFSFWKKNKKINTKTFVCFSSQLDGLVYQPFFCWLSRRLAVLHVRYSRESPFDFCQIEIGCSAVANVGTCHFLFDETEEKLNWTKIMWFLSCFFFPALYSIRFVIKFEWLSVNFKNGTRFWCFLGNFIRPWSPLFATLYVYMYVF